MCNKLIYTEFVLLFVIALYVDIQSEVEILHECVCVMYKAIVLNVAVCDCSKEWSPLAETLVREQREHSVSSIRGYESGSDTQHSPKVMCVCVRANTVVYYCSLLNGS